MGLSVGQTINCKQADISKKTIKKYSFRDVGTQWAVRLLFVYSLIGTYNFTPVPNSDIFIEQLFGWNLESA